MNDIGRPQVDCGELNLRNASVELRLRLNPQALAMLEREIGAGFLALPRRGAEVGGILLGEIACTDSEWTVDIEAIDPVPIEYQYGPSYRLSAAERENFRERAESTGAGARRIGWYRSNTRREHEPEDADRQISETFFRSGKSIFLFCEPFPDGRIEAICVLMRASGAQTDLRFELGRFSRLDGIVNSEPERRAGSTTGVVRRFETVTALASPALNLEPPAHTPPQASRHFISGANLRIAIAMVLSGAAAYYARGHVAMPAHAADGAALNPGGSFGLRAEYRGSSLLFEWDRKSPQITAARAAVFTITEGSRKRVLNLSPRELRNGAIFYKAAADEISAELEIVAPGGGAASQSIRIIGASAPVTGSGTAAGAGSPAAPESPAFRARQRTPVARFLAPPLLAPQPHSIVTIEAPPINEADPARPAGLDSALVVALPAAPAPSPSASSGSSPVAPEADGPARAGQTGRAPRKQHFR